MEELETNKSKAEDYLDVIIDMHKRFINSEHVEFKKMRKLKKGKGIRYKNNFNLWFQEEIASDPNDVSQGISFSHWSLVIQIISLRLCFYSLISSIDMYYFPDNVEEFQDANGAEANGSASESGGKEQFFKLYKLRQTFLDDTLRFSVSPLNYFQYFQVNLELTSQ